MVVLARRRRSTTGGAIPASPHSPFLGCPSPEPSETLLPVILPFLYLVLDPSSDSRSSMKRAMVHSDSGDGDVGVEEADEDAVLCGIGEKKRRLSTEQVRAMERSFETENRLEPERLARELGLQQRQVAVWFQNRRARWKAKQLERDYAALRHSYDALRRDKDALLVEIKELKAKLGDEDALSSVKEELAVSDVEAPVVGAAQGSSDSDSSGVVSEAAVADASSPQLQLQHGEVFFHGHVLKVEEEAAAFLGDDDDAVCGGFFADLPPPPPWWTEPMEHWA